MKPVDSSVTTPAPAIIDEFVAYKKSTKGLTPRGEEWLRDMTGRFLKQLGMSVIEVGPQQIVGYLAPYSDRPFQRHGRYRALKSLNRWLKKMRCILENPMEYIEAPKVSVKVLNVVTGIFADSTLRTRRYVGTGARILRRDGRRAARIVHARGFSEETVRQEQEEVDIWGRGRASRVRRRLANTRTDGVCCRGGLLDPRARGLRDIGHLDAQAAAGRGIGPRTIMIPFNRPTHENMTAIYIGLSYPIK